MSFAPLAGARVVDVTGSIAGPYCTGILGALGADVVKVEHPERGDEARHWGPPFVGGQGSMFVAVNAGKRSLALDLRRGRDVLLRLVDGADVFVQSLRPGRVEELGLGPDELRARNGRLVYCSIGAFGRAGPLRDQPGYDAQMQAAAGMISVTGEPGRPGVRVGTSITDLTTGLWGALGVLAALADRDRTGAGAAVDVSLYESAVSLLGYHLTGYFADGTVPGRDGTRFPMVAPYQTWSASDGELMVSGSNDGLFRSLCRAIGRPDLADDPRYRTNADRVRHRDELADAIGAELAKADRAAWLERFAREGVPAAPVQDVAEVAEAEQTRALGLLQRLGGATTVAPPLSVDGSRVAYRSQAPRLGEHTAEVLAEAGLADEEVAELAAAGVVRVA